jgi:hypothetical protein
VVHHYTCAKCGGTFESARPDADAHDEARKLWDADGHAPHMVVICDDCFTEIMRHERRLDHTSGARNDARRGGAG